MNQAEKRKIAFEGVDEVLFFKNIYTKKGIGISAEQMETMIYSDDLNKQVREMLEEKNDEIKDILKCNLPYFLISIQPPLSEEVKKGFFTDNMIMGCSFDCNYDVWTIRPDNTSEEIARAALQTIGDVTKLKHLPEFTYPSYINNPFDCKSILEEEEEEDE